MREPTGFLLEIGSFELQERRNTAGRQGAFLSFVEVIFALSGRNLTNTGALN